MRPRPLPAASLVLALAAATVGGTALPLPVAAQSATPTAAAACDVAPRPVDELVGWWFAPPGTPAATPLPAVPLADPTYVPTGGPADPAVAGQLEALARQLVACDNAGDLPRRLALFTDRLAQQFGPPPGVTEVQVRATLALPAPAAADRAASFVALHDPRTLPDGRVAALLEVDDPTASPIRQQVLVVFRQPEGGGDWLIDDLVPVLVPATPVGLAAPAGATA